MNRLEKNLMEYLKPISLEVKPIMYKSKVYDTGIILDKRKYRFTLKGKVNPNYIFQPMGLWSKYLSEIGPQKNNFMVYIPLANIPVRKFMVHVKMCQGKKYYTLTYILSKNDNYVEVIRIPDHIDTLKEVYAFMRELKGIETKPVAAIV